MELSTKKTVRERLKVKCSPFRYILRERLKISPPRQIPSVRERLKNKTFPLAGKTYYIS